MPVFQPQEIAKTTWEKWVSLLKSARREQAPQLLLRKISQEMQSVISLFLLVPLSFLNTSYACLDLMWEFLEAEHKETLPEQACQRSGKCCMRQTVRVSMFEANRIAAAVSLWPQDMREALFVKIEKWTQKPFIEPVLGIGVDCPFLAKSKLDNKFICTVHTVRPQICKLTVVSKPNGADCPIWKDGKFPVLPPEIVKPYLELFSWCRASYVKHILKRPDFYQMILLPFGVARFLNKQLSKHVQPEAEAVYPHLEGYDENLYLEPVKESETTDAPI